jgi:hypothetical protein
VAHADKVNKIMLANKQGKIKRIVRDCLSSINEFKTLLFFFITASGLWFSWVVFYKNGL